MTEPDIEDPEDIPVEGDGSPDEELVPEGYEPPGEDRAYERSGDYEEPDSDG